MNAKTPNWHFFSAHRSCKYTFTLTCILWLGAPASCGRKLFLRKKVHKLIFCPSHYAWQSISNQLSVPKNSLAPALEGQYGQIDHFIGKIHVLRSFRVIFWPESYLNIRNYLSLLTYTEFHHNSQTYDPHMTLFLVRFKSFLSFLACLWIFHHFWAFLGLFLAWKLLRWA